MATPSPTAALSPEGFYSLYLGGLSIDAEKRRQEACYVLLLLGRLGLRPAEINHLQEGWVDWSRGEIQVPAHDPCACRECWRRAHEKKTNGDERALEAVLTETMWSPPEESDAARTIPFGWSHRLTAALEGVLGEREFLDMTPTEIDRLLAEAAENAWKLEPETVSTETLRATAAEFLATAGFGPRRLAELLALEEETAGEFARVGGGELREHLYRDLTAGDAPDICGEDSPYRLVCDPSPFEREPFDPREFTARWRSNRGEKVEPRGRNPRPPEPPTDVEFDRTKLDVREPGADSGSQLVSRSLSDWVRRRESQRRQYAETGSTGVGIDAYRDEVTAPVIFSTGTRFAGQGIEGGRPTGGSVVLGQQELVFLSRDDTGVADQLRVPFSTIVDVAPGYVPGPLEGVFGETVGVAYNDTHGERKILVCELPDGLYWEFLNNLFSALVKDTEALFANLSEGIRDPSDMEPSRRLISIMPRTLKITDPESDHLPLRLRLSTIVGIEEKPMQCETDYNMGLTIHYLRVNANVITVELRAIDEQKQTFLKRHLMEHHEKQKEKARNASLSSDQREVLDALHDAGEGRDLVAIADMNPSKVASVVNSLKELDLVRDSRTGVALTGTGYLVTSQGSLLYDSSS